MDPNAVHEPETEHDHQHKRTAVTNQWQRNAGDRQQCDRHTHVLENVREDKSGDAHNEKQAQLIAGQERNKKTRHQEQGETTDKKYSTYKSPLLADGGENVVIVNSGSGKKAKLDLRVWRFESFTRPTARADGNEGLINCPGGTLFVDVRVSKGRDPLLLVWL